MLSAPANDLYTTPCTVRTAMNLVATLISGLSLNAFLIILILVVVGIVVTHFARIIGLQGLELWLPLGLIVTYAIGPLAGIATALAILVPSFIIRRFSIRHLLFIIVSMAATFYLVTVLALGAASFGLAFVSLTLLYNLISGTMYKLDNAPLLKNVKFGVLSISTAWGVFGTIGPQLANLIARGKSPIVLWHLLTKLF